MLSTTETNGGINKREKRIRVLVCDDLARVRKGLRLALETDDDFELVGEARSGQEAVALAAELHPDVVLMDLQMPGLDGIGATREISGRRLARAVVILTIYGDAANRERAHKAGATAFLDKSAGTEDLLATLRNVTGA